MKMDMSQYLDVFLEESKEHLDSLNDRLLQLEKNPGNTSALNEIFRAAHTLKGMSSTMGFDDVADLTHHMEDVLSDLKEGVLEADSGVVDVLFQCFDRLQLMIDNIASTGSSQVDGSDLTSILIDIKAGRGAAGPGAPPADSSAAPPVPVDAAAGGTADTGFEFNDYDLTVFKEIISQGNTLKYARIQVDPACVMKSVRVFMIFKVLEEYGEILKTVPEAQDLDEGKFEESFEIVLAEKSSEQGEWIDRVNNIAEVKILETRELTLDELSVRPATEEETAPPAAASSPAAAATPAATATATAASAAPAQAAEAPEANEKRTHKAKQTVRVDIERLDSLMNLVGELVMHKGRLEQIGAAHSMTDLNETIEQIDRVSADLQSVVMKVRMVPVEQVFNRFPRMVRDLAKDLGKEVDFIMEGKETELDRTVIDEIGDPLIHLLRNALDHGLESAEERMKADKPMRGSLILRARHEGNNVYIEVEDDGGGIDYEAVLTKAISKGLVTAKEGEALTKAEIVDFLFESGFSTAQNVTEVSGRGVGLDVVRTKIESLNGEILVDTRPGQGTKFRVKLPLTLAIIQALMVAVRDEVYAIPLSSVDETTIITPNEIKMIQKQEVITLRGNVLPLFRLGEIIEVPGDRSEDDEMYVVIVRKSDKQIGIMVDTLIGQQEIVIKSLGKLLTGIPGLAGGIVGGDGNVRLILDIATLF